MFKRQNLKLLLNQNEVLSDSNFIIHEVGPAADILSDFIHLHMLFVQNVSLHLQVLELLCLAIVFDLKNLRQLN